MNKINELDIAGRIKQAISDNGGYNNVSEKTGISQSTLVRMASGKTDPKLKDVMKIADITNIPLHFIAYGFMNPSDANGYDKEAELQKRLDDYYAKTEARLLEIEKVLIKGPNEDIVKNNYYTDELDSIGENMGTLKKIEKEHYEYMKSDSEKEDHD